MSISTSLLFDRATERMSALQNRLSTTQAQLTESKQVLNPSGELCLNSGNIKPVLPSERNINNFNVQLLKPLPKTRINRRSDNHFPNPVMAKILNRGNTNIRGKFCTSGVGFPTPAAFREIDEGGGKFRNRPKVTHVRVCNHFTKSFWC
mgnify:CR=1 FL=1